MKLALPLLLFRSVSSSVEFYSKSIQSHLLNHKTLPRPFQAILEGILSIPLDDSIVISNNAVMTVSERDEYAENKIYILQWVAADR